MQLRKDGAKVLSPAEIRAEYTELFYWMHLFQRFDAGEIDLIEKILLGVFLCAFLVVLLVITHQRMASGRSYFIPRAPRKNKQSIYVGRVWHAAYTQATPHKTNLVSIQQSNEKERGREERRESDLDHARDTIGSRDKHLSFLEAHIANLVQSISQSALKPSKEEPKKEG